MAHLRVRLFFPIDIEMRIEQSIGRCFKSHRKPCGWHNKEREVYIVKILVIGSDKKASAVDAQMVMAGHAVGYVYDALAAMKLLKRCPYDLILIVECERLEEVDLVAEELKRAALVNSLTTTPYVFVLWGAVCGFEPARQYGLKAIDILMEDFSPRRCEQAYDFAMRNEL